MKVLYALIYIRKTKINESFFSFVYGWQSRIYTKVSTKKNHDISFFNEKNPHIPISLTL